MERDRAKEITALIRNHVNNSSDSLICGYCGHGPYIHICTTCGKGILSLRSAIYSPCSNMNRHELKTEECTKCILETTCNSDLINSFQKISRKYIRRPCTIVCLVIWFIVTLLRLILFGCCVCFAVIACLPCFIVKDNIFGQYKDDQTATTEEV